MMFILQNGILLTRDLASNFENGKISFKYKNGHFYVVAFDFHCLQYDGLQMDENWRSRNLVVNCEARS